MENADGELFGFERTAEVIGRECGKGPTGEVLVEAIVAEVKQFAEGVAQGDDQTVVVLKLGA